MSSVPSTYKPTIPETNSSVQNGNGPQKTAGKARMRFPDTPLEPEQDKAQGGGKRAYTPGGPAGS